ncbi:nucleotidyltransferase [bacterium]|nr:MAG: nucleotidyltransferase [bacterium]
MKRSLEEIKKILKDILPEIREKYGVKKIGVFGSYVKGEETPESDLDILIEFEEHARISLIDFVELEQYLSEILGIKVDLVEKTALKPRIGRRILEEVVYITPF